MKTEIEKEKDRVRSRAWAAANRERSRERSRAWRAANPDRHRASNKAWRLANSDYVRDIARKRHYGMQPGEWDVMFAAQGLKCAVCSSKEHGGKHWHTDHCHTAKRVRGILCHHCNIMLGNAKNKIRTLLSGVAYLQVLGG